MRENMLSASAKYTLDPEKTLAILVGVKEYESLEDISPAYNNIDALAELLKDQSLFGLPAENVISIYGGTSLQIKQRISDSLPESKSKAQKARLETLLIYFTGHGIRSRNNQDYYLAGQDANVKWVNMDGSSAISFETIKRLISNSGINKRIVILDACNSGMATMGEDGALPEEDLKIFDNQGTFTITSSNSTERSYFDHKEDLTDFTGELVRIIQEGVGLESDMVDLSTLYRVLKTQVKLRNPKMSPQYRASHEITGEDFLFFKNRQYDGDAKKIIGFEKDLQTELERLKTGQVRPVKRSLKGMVAEIKEELEEGPRKERLLQKIDREIQFCEFFPRYRKLMELRPPVGYEETIRELKRSQAHSKSLEASMRSELDLAKQKHEQDVRHYEEEMGEKNKQLEKLKRALGEAQERIDGLDRRVVELQSAKEKSLPSGANQEMDETVAFHGEPSRSKVKWPGIIKGLEKEMVTVKGGAFTLGEGAGSVGPLSPGLVHVPTFALSPYLVTQAMWRHIMGAEPEELMFRGQSTCPVEGVSWYDVQAFLQALNRLTGKAYRLPSEAEWEYVAKDGEKNAPFRYAGGNQIDRLGWYASNSQKKTHPVGKFQPNELGVFDMSGNVWEWCQDHWREDYSKVPTNGKAWEDPEALDDASRVVRGGGWNSKAIQCQVTHRSSWPPGFKLGHVGFRLAHSI